MIDESIRTDCLKPSHWNRHGAKHIYPSPNPNTALKQYSNHFYSRHMRMEHWNDNFAMTIKLTRERSLNLQILPPQALTWELLLTSSPKSPVACRSRGIASRPATCTTALSFEPATVVDKLLTLDSIVPQTAEIPSVCRRRPPCV